LLIGHCSTEEKSNNNNDEKEKNALETTTVGPIKGCIGVKTKKGEKEQD